MEPSHSDARAGAAPIRVAFQVRTGSRGKRRKKENRKEREGVSDIEGSHVSNRCKFQEKTHAFIVVLTRFLISMFGLSLANLSQLTLFGRAQQVAQQSCLQGIGRGG